MENGENMPNFPVPDKQNNLGNIMKNQLGHMELSESKLPVVEIGNEKTLPQIRLGIDSRYYMNNFIFLIISQIKIF
jgi:hypothetical protein